MRFLRKYVRTKQNHYRAKMLRVVESTLVAVPPHSVELNTTTSSPQWAPDHGYLKAEGWSGSRLAVNVASLFHHLEHLTLSTRLSLPDFCLSLVGICQRPCRSPRRLWADHKHNTQEMFARQDLFLHKPLTCWRSPGIFSGCLFAVCLQKSKTKGSMTLLAIQLLLPSAASELFWWKLSSPCDLLSFILSIFLPSLFYSHFLRQILLTSPSDLLPILLCFFKGASYSLAVPARHSSMQCKHCCV